MIHFPSEVYVVLGIDDNEHDQVLGVFRLFSDAKGCCQVTPQEPYYDLWIEKHALS